MKNQNRAELHVLDRIMYLLEEESVSRLIEADTDFANFIENLYGTVHQRSMTSYSK